MKHGLVMFPTDYSIRPEELARAAEERGFESLFFPEHTHIPASRRTPYPAGGDLPKEYFHSHDPFVALSMAAAVTKRIKLATGICLVIERDPIVLAKEVASLDLLSERPRHLRHRRRLERRGDGEPRHGVQNAVEAAPRARRGDEGDLAERGGLSITGNSSNFDPIWSYPKPAQKPHPPILLGGHGEMALKRVVAYCDGWLPISMMAGDLKKQIGELHRLAREKGRDPKSISISVFWSQPDRQAIDAYGEMGAERVIFALPSESPEKVLPILDGYAKLIR